MNIRSGRISFQTSDTLIDDRKPDIVVVDKRAKRIDIIGIDIPGDASVDDKKLENMEEMQTTKRRNKKTVGNEESYVYPNCWGN